jgi:hypothetical protein
MDVPTKQQIRDQLAALRTPIDVEDLAARGVIRKVGSRWEILKPEMMPTDAWLHVTSVELRTKGPARTTLYGFRRRSRTAKGRT